MSIDDYHNDPDWKESIGEKLGKIHFRNGHNHAECDPETGVCFVHYDKHDPYESPSEFLKHVWESDLGKAAMIGIGALFVTAIALKYR